jgi:hypothetical protein
MKWDVILTFKDKNIILIYFDPKVTTFFNKKTGKFCIMGNPHARKYTKSQSVDLLIHESKYIYIFLEIIVFDSTLNYITIPSKVRSIDIVK